MATGPAPTLSAGQWLAQYREDAPTSSNQGSADVAFQRWFHFKEAFSPKFVADTLAALPYRVNRCLDPFGGSGTTAVTCRMLGLSATTVEVNPFLADLIETKLTPVSAAAFRADYERLLSTLSLENSDRVATAGMPATLLEPGCNGRWVFSRDVFATARAIARQAETLAPEHGRLLRVLLGSILVANSNVLINGKGRRYRRNWRNRACSVDDLISSMDRAVDEAVQDLTAFAGLPRGDQVVLQGDARTKLREVEQADVAIFSPPYPNSFDYTDVYNLELWMLGYLQSSADNRNLRQSTLRSHVQLKWQPSAASSSAPTLKHTVEALQQARRDLWNPHIPEMVGYYFEDLVEIFDNLRTILPSGHHAVVAIGDSQYGGIKVDVGTILKECVAPLGFELSEHGAIRSMRTSSQHGGGFGLKEHCLVFQRT